MMILHLLRKDQTATANPTIVITPEAINFFFAYLGALAVIACGYFLLFQLQDSLEDE